MKIVLQRSKEASCVVEEKKVAEISSGLVLLVGLDKQDTEEAARELADKVLSFRIFSDEDDKMNLSIQDVKGGILVIPNFTLSANTEKGNRPSFDAAMKPKEAKQLFDYFVDCLKKSDLDIQPGVFGADMKVSLINNGPVTFTLEV